MYKFEVIFASWIHLSELSIHAVPLLKFQDDSICCFTASQLISI